MFGLLVWIIILPYINQLLEKQRKIILLKINVIYTAIFRPFLITRDIFSLAKIILVSLHSQLIN